MLYALGSNANGQLGLDHWHDVSVPTACSDEIQFTEPLKQIAAGGNHTLILDTAGRIVTLGAVLGGDPRFFKRAAPISTVRTIFCAATWAASTFCIDDGKGLVVKGEGDKGELGQGPDVLKVWTGDLRLISIPGLGENGLRVVDLASGLFHTVAVLSDGTVYGWGKARQGQLGERAEVVWLPRKIEGLDFKVVKAVCGRDFTYLVGNPEEGQHVVLGNDWRYIKTDAPARVRKWQQIGANWRSIHVLFQNGTIRSWGRGDHGQLRPPGLPPISMMANGSEHSLAVTRDGKVLAWGWNEHGNCGTNKNVNGDVFYEWNELSLPEVGPVRGCAAGCATSWIWTDTSDSRQ